MSTTEQAATGPDSHLYGQVSDNRAPDQTNAFRLQPGGAQDGRDSVQADHTTLVTLVLRSVEATA